MTALISSTHMESLPKGVKEDLLKRFHILVNQLKLCAVTLYPIKLAGENAKAERYLGSQKTMEMQIPEAKFRVSLHASKMLILCELVYADNPSQELLLKHEAGLKNILKKGIPVKAGWRDRVELVLLEDYHVPDEPPVLSIPAMSPDVKTSSNEQESAPEKDDPTGSKAWFAEDDKRLALACLGIYENSNCSVTAAKAVADQLGLKGSSKGMLQRLNLFVSRDLLNTHGLIRKSSFKRAGKVHYALTRKGEDLIVSELGEDSIKKTEVLSPKQVEKRLTEINREQIELAAKLAQANSGSSPETDILVAQIDELKRELELKVSSLKEAISKKEADLEEIRSALNDEVIGLGESISELDDERNVLLGLA